VQNQILQTAYIVRFEVFTAMTIQVVVYRILRTYSAVTRCQNVGDWYLVFSVVSLISHFIENR